MVWFPVSAIKLLNPLCIGIGDFGVCQIKHDYLVSILHTRVILLNKSCIEKINFEMITRKSKQNEIF